MTPVEKVARAIADESIFIYERDPERWDGLARAAILALREPSEEMLEAGNKQWWGNETPLNIFREMIDAALTPLREE